RKSRVERRHRSGGVLCARQMQCVGSGKLRRIVSDEPIREREVLRAMAQAFARGAQGVEVRKGLVGRSARKTPSPEFTRNDGADLEIGEVTDDDRCNQ